MDNKVKIVPVCPKHHKIMIGMHWVQVTHDILHISDMFEPENDEVHEYVEVTCDKCTAEFHGYDGDHTTSTETHEEMIERLSKTAGKVC